MVDDWNHARRLREFLDEYDRRLGEHERGDVTVLDPMNRSTEIAKELESSDDVLAQQSQGRVGSSHAHAGFAYHAP